MEWNQPQTRACISFESATATVRTGMNQGNWAARYWGVLCRTCRRLIAFDASPYLSFCPGAATMRPGAIRCSEGHNHIYFPHDFGFRESGAPVTEATMRESRAQFWAINSPGERTSHDYVQESEPTSESEGKLEGGKARKAVIGPDPRREQATTAAKASWANWAIKKMG